MSSGSRQASLALAAVVIALAAMNYHYAATSQPLRLVAVQSTLAAAATGHTRRQQLRVCADPNNLPFSNRDGEGFENELARLIADDLGVTLQYAWWPQRRGFLKSTLRAHRCELVIGVPSDYQMLQTTRPYYSSSYVFVARRDRHLNIDSFDDPRLKTLRIGVHSIGDDYSNVPPVQSLARRGIVQNIHGYPIYGAYSQPDPPRNLIDAVARGEVDVAIAWGPLAGYFSRREPVALEVRPVTSDDSRAGLPMRFAISMGVRRGDDELQERVQDVLERRSTEIRKILERYGVPLVDPPVRVTRRTGGV